MVKTVIWEDEWFYELSDKAQRLYIYLITNKNTEISGLYRLPMREIVMYMKYKNEVVEKLLKELLPKVAYVDGWVIIPNYPEHQNVTNNLKVQKSIEKYIKTVPSHILNHKSEIINHKSEPMDRLSIGYKEKEVKTEKMAKTKADYGEFKAVKLTTEECGKLVEKLGKNTTDELITELDSYIASKGAKYKSHYATILAWARRKGVDTSRTNKYAGI